MSISDPLALVAIEAGLIQNPLADSPAQGENKLEAQQRSAVIGEPVPIVFCRRDEVAGTGGVLISPPATEARFQNDTTNNLTTSYHLVLSEGQIGSIQVRDVFQGACRVGSFSQTYNRRAGTWTPGNVVIDRNQGYRRFFTTELINLSTQDKVDKYNAILTATLVDPAELEDEPYNLIGDWDEATLIDPANPEKNASWDYDTIYSRTLIKDIKPTNYKTPECSYYCGSIGTYTGLSTLSFQMTTGDGNDRWNRQVHCFIRNGIQVPRLIEGTTGSSNNFADLVQWALLNCAKLPVELIDATALTAAANFLDVNNFNCDIIIKDSENLADFLSRLAPYFLLAETRNNGKRGLRPLLPVNNNHTIKTTAVSAVFTFTEEHIQPGSFELSYVPLVDRKPFCVQAVWRQQLTDDFGIIRTSEVRYLGEADGPFEQHDLSAFCTREDHAVKVAAYIRSRRKHITHTARIKIRPIDLGVNLVPGDLVRVKLARIAAGMNASFHDFFYEVTRIAESVTGETQLDLTHFPIDAQGRSLVALDVVNTNGAGILLTSSRSGVSCDLNSSADTSVPAETGTTGTPVDQPVAMSEPDEESPPAAPATVSEDRNAAIYFHSIEWDDLELVVRIRVAPTGRAAVEGLGSLTATIASGTVVAYAENGQALSPQPNSLPSLNFSGTVATEWSAVVEPNKPATVPPDRIFQGEFRIAFTSGDFPPYGSGQNYRMPINVTSTSGGFDQVTILNSGLAIFNASLTPPPANTDLLLLHFNGANNSTTFTDNGANQLTLTVNAGAKISTTQSKFGGASGYFAGLNYTTGYGDYVQASSSSLALGTGDFTIEAWIYPIRDTGVLPTNGLPINYKGICAFPDNSEDTGVYVYQYGSSTGCTLMWFDGINNEAIESEDYLSYETWHHIAVVRSGGVISLFCNGDKQTSTYSGNPSITGPRVRIGNDDLGSGPLTGEPYKGYIDELRIRGSAVYTNNFTPPTAPFS